MRALGVFMGLRNVSEDLRRSRGSKRRFKRSQGYFRGLMDVSESLRSISGGLRGVPGILREFWAAQGL